MFRMRLNIYERQALELLAQEERRSMSEITRELIREEAMRQGLWPPPANQYAQAQAQDGQEARGDG